MRATELLFILFEMKFKRVCGEINTTRFRCNKLKVVLTKGKDQT